MATRQRAQRGDDRGEFEGRVRKWKREWQPAGEGWKAKDLVFCRWIPTEERDTASPGKRFPHIKPLPTPGGRPGPPGFMRPRHVAPVAAMPAPMPALKLKLSSAAVAAKTGSGAGAGSVGAVAALSPPSVAPAVAAGPSPGVQQPPPK